MMRRSIAISALAGFITALAAAQTGAQLATICVTLGQPNSGAFCGFCIIGLGDGIPGKQYSYAPSGDNPQPVITATVPSTTGGCPNPDVGGSGPTGLPQGTSTQIPLFRVDFFGSGNTTEIYLTAAGNHGDVLQYEDTTAYLSNAGRAGIALLKSGTGAFEGALGGTLTYNYECSPVTDNPCYNGVGTPGPYTYKFDLEGGGTINIPAASVATALPSLYPSVLKQVVTAVSETATTVLMGASDPVGNPFNDSPPSKLKPHPDTSGGSGAGGTMAITPPWQVNPATYNLTASCSNLTSGCWLTVPTATGTVPAFTDTPIAVNFSQGNLGSGVYPASISMTLTPTGDSGPPTTQVVPFNLVITNSAAIVDLSETGIQFQALAGSQPAPLVHSISVATLGTAFSYQATASTLSGGNWLSASPASGTSAPGAPGTINLNANPAGLSPGSYFGRVDVSVSGAVGSSQSVEVELTIATGGTAPILSATGLVFIAPQTVSPAAQTVMLSTFSSAPITISAGVDADSTQSWLSVTASSTALSAAAPVTLNVAVNTQGLLAGAYTTTFNVLVPATESSYPVNVVLIVTPAVGVCAPTQLLPVLTNLSTGFELPAVAPVSLQAQIFDDCGNPLNSGVVQVTPPSGDAPVEMLPLGGGQWAGTWLPHETTGGAAALALTAQSESNLQGSTAVSGTLNANPSATVVTPGGIVNAADPVVGAPLAPGEFISIYGSNLAPTNASSPGLTYSTTLAGTQVLLGAVALPLQFVSPGLINAVVPFETPVNGLQELLISQNGSYSLPETVVVASVSPAIFTQSQNGQGAGVIVVFKADGTVYETSPTQTASAGDLLLIYCDGLGPVNPAIADGLAAPSSPVSNTVNPVTATIGGQPAQVAFAGLAPGYAGVYQVNVTVPTGVAPGGNVPVILTVAGFSSAPATVSIQ